MAKQVIRLTESELKRFISEAVKRSLSEDWEADYNKAMDKADYESARQEYDSKNIFGKLMAMVSGKRPKDSNPEQTLEELLNQYVNAFNKEHGIGKRSDYKTGESFHSKMSYSGDKSNKNQPVLTATYSNGNGVEQSRRAFQNDGSSSEWGIGFPHSEIGHTVRNDRLSTSNPEIQGEYDKFKQHRGEISNAIRRRNEKMKK